ncbi:hypothetical protein BJX65DRAFT_311033 [Aspergillus insuetus]
MPNGLGRSQDVYTVALICALPVAMAALMAVLDEIHDEVESKRDHKIKYPLLAHRFNLLRWNDDSDFHRADPSRHSAQAFYGDTYGEVVKLSRFKGYQATALIIGMQQTWVDDCAASTESIGSDCGLYCDRAETEITQLASLLLNDNVLKPLFARATLLAGPVTLQKQFERRIKKYGGDLNNQASTSIQRQAAGFILQSARHTAVYMRRELLHETTELSIREEVDMRNAARINSWLESQYENFETDHSDRLFDDAVDLDDCGGPDDSASRDEIPFTSLDEVKEFIVSGHAISNLRHELRTWVEAKGREIGTDHNIMSDHAPTFWSRVMDICSPAPAGYRRIYYLCGCGGRAYIDVKEILPGGLNKFRARLLASVNAVRDRSQHSASSGTLQAPPQAHLSSSPNARFACSSVVRNGTPASYTPQQGRGVTSQLESAAPDPEDNKFLLLCINTKTSTVLENIEVGSFGNDEFLFRAISQEYRRVREEHEFKIIDIVPLWAGKLIRNVSRRLPHFVRIPQALRYYVGGISLYKIHSGDFVRFQLVPIGLRCCPTWFKTRDVPPEAEVKAKRYLYQPVPVDDVEIDCINNLEHLLKPGPRTDDFWINRFPKKTRSPLERERGAAGQRVIGWGIRINEGPNLAMISLLVLVTLLGFGATVAIYAVTTSDNNSAFALGAFLVAVFVAYLGHQYFTWRETA